MKGREQTMKVRDEKGTEPFVQLASRIPLSLYRRLKVYAVSHDLSVMSFLSESLEAALTRAGAGASPAPRKRSKKAA